MHGLPGDALDPNYAKLQRLNKKIADDFGLMHVDGWGNEIDAGRGSARGDGE